jgi:hypothetical protein
MHTQEFNIFVFEISFDFLKKLTIFWLHMQKKISE